MLKLIVIVLLVVSSNAFITSTTLRNPASELHLKTTVPKRFSFRTRGSIPDGVSEHDHSADDTFHLRQVHFIHDKQHQPENDKNATLESKREAKKVEFGWSHRDFADSLDP
eukprot:g854.t1 g854   contig10:852967-853418(+)